MPDKYLDPHKSVIISAPAGSGKTEKLARRYISLLSSGSALERILCITFTEKAAAEMKERIMKILEVEDPALLDSIRPKTPMMRISTIHAFCLKILKRFSIELGLDPSLNVMDEHRARDLWNEALFDTLISERDTGDEGVMFGILRDGGLKGWGPLKRTLDIMAKKAPMPEMLLLSGQAETSIEGDADEGARILTAYARCLGRYRELKREHHFLDFNDLELLASEALSRVPNATDILFSFDEHTDHILVDEFQDTSTLQWRILDKLTEEWRSGRGPKRETGSTPTIFLVGDEKQSIYMFRGANVAMFSQAKKRFSDWLGKEYHYVEAIDNYRCLPAIVDFTNALFSHLMGSEANDIGTRYARFEARRQGKGFVGLLTLTPGDNVRHTRQREADAIASLISRLAGSHEVHDSDGHKRPARFEDMAVLLKKRTHLVAYEDSLRRMGVPFIVIKGIGFFNEPEVALLVELVNFITDRNDPYPAFALLRSPMFSMDYPTLLKLSRQEGTVLERLERSGRPEGENAARVLRSVTRSSGIESLSMLIERTLMETGMWTHLAEKQRLSNVKKFIAMVEGYEDQCLSPVEIRDRLLRQRGSDQAPKANISSEGMDAVKIMTIHAAKGLQFPMVFLPGMEESLTPKSEPIVFDDSGETIRMGFEEDNDKRKKEPIFRLQRQKHEEEEKRLFYVAVTRARDYILMSGAPGKKITGRLEYLDRAFGIFQSDTPPADIPLEILTQEDIKAGPPAPVRRPAHKQDENLPVHTAPLDHRPSKVWEDVTRDDDDKQPGRGHGVGRTIIGTVMHRLMEEISRGNLSPDHIPRRAQTLMRIEGGSPELITPLTEELRALMKSPIWQDVVTPREGAHTELPFILDKGETAYKGRIDRVIIREGTAHVYDYKTFPFSDSEIKGIVSKYSRQMGLYREAAERLFRMPARAFLVLTARQEVVEVE
ncbi:UvrD-helicase domain-containing protein [Nitrospirota bacterium]